MSPITASDADPDDGQQGPPRVAGKAAQCIFGGHGSDHDRMASAGCRRETKSAGQIAANIAVTVTATVP